MYYATIGELINSVNNMEISYRNLHSQICIKNNDNDIIKIPYKSILKDYIPLLQSSIITLEMDDVETAKYRYKPKLLSFKLYDTTELWSELLEINNMISVIEFDKNKIKVFEPRAFKVLLNEIMILEGII